MKDLVVRLAALDPDAVAAVRVIAYFDRLVEGRAGLQPIVRGAAVLAGCPARLVDDERHMHIRVGPDGVADPAAGPLDPDWLCEPVLPGEAATIYLERPGPAGPVDAMVLERAATAARGVIDRTRGRAPAADPASVELLLDAAAPEPARRQAARRLGLTEPCRAVALDGGRAQIVGGPGRPVLGPSRAGVGPAGPLLDLPSSWEAARVALRFAATGTHEDPGPRVVYAEELGGLVLLASSPTTEPIPDVRALDRAAAAAPWVLETLHAVSESISLRAAATVLRVHHSTLQDRIGHAEHVLGWNVREPHGRLRLQLALVLRRLQRAAS